MGEPVIRSVANALQVLDMVMEQGSICVNDAAKRLEIDRSNAYRLLKTLERGEYLSSVGKRYDLGYKLELFAAIGVNPLQIRLIAEPIMREVAQALEHAVSLGCPYLLEVEVCREYPYTGGESFGWWDVPFPGYIREKRERFDAAKREEFRRV